jgi:transcription initiation factor IIE alpha subunit
MAYDILMQRYVVAHPLRHKIASEILKSGGIFQEELGRRLQYSSFLISVHLLELAEQGLVNSEPKLTGQEDKQNRTIMNAYLTPTEDLTKLQEFVSRLGEL